MTREEAIKKLKGAWKSHEFIDSMVALGLLVLEERVYPHDRIAALEREVLALREDKNMLIRGIDRLRTDPLYAVFGEYHFIGRRQHERIIVSVSGKKIEVVENVNNINYLAQQIPASK